MTNMPEAKLAREAELCYATMALATDYDVWHEEHDAVSVEAVVANLMKNVATARVVLGRVLPRVGGPLRRWMPERARLGRHHQSRGLPAATRKRLGLLLDRYFPAKKKGAPWLSPWASPTAIDVVGIGNALVDVLSQEKDELLDGLGLVKGAMHLIDEPHARKVYDAMGPGMQISGGSAANTIVGVASFGARAHYVGKVKTTSSAGCSRMTCARPASATTRRPPPAGPKPAGASS